MKRPCQVRANTFIGPAIKALGRLLFRVKIYNVWGGKGGAALVSAISFA